MLCAYLAPSINIYAPRGVSMWPSVASSLYAALLRGDASGVKLRALSYDASIASGWGLGLQTSEDPTLRIFSGTYPQGTHCSVQVHNEGHAAALAIAAADKIVDLTDAIIILRNDCAPALSALAVLPVQCTISENGADGLGEVGGRVAQRGGERGAGGRDRMEREICGRVCYGGAAGEYLHFFSEGERAGGDGAGAFALQ